MRRACDRLAWPVVAFALLLVCARAYAATDETSGICSSMDIRNNPDQISRLQGCKVIEGQLSIVLMERVSDNQFQNVSFPNLREVTDYIVMYRTKGVINLGDMFPNLTVIRGIRLFKDFALVVFDNKNLEALGLRSLMKIERGGVRIQQNDKLCYTNTIDWARITSDSTNNVIRLNYDTRLCGLCPNAQSRIQDHRQLNQQCPADAHGRLLCWDAKHCQKTCPRTCDDSAGCTDSGECCHKNCLGGCTGPTARDCHVCQGYSFKDGAERVCTETCPYGTYKLSRRCVTQDVCRKTPPPPPDIPEADQHRSPPKINAYKIYQNSCVFNCPTGTMEVGDVTNSTCQPCDSSGCERECSGGKVDSVAAAELFRGCTHITGKLEISIRASGGNVLRVLENSLGEIREINGSLQVSRAYPLVSLMFLKNLRKIYTENKDQVLLIFNNPNLELLWDWDTHGPISIMGGTLSINFNPKLCYNQIVPLQNMTYNPRSNFTENEVSQDNNGDQAACTQKKLNLTVSELRSTAAVLSWSVYCPDDIRRLLGYSVYYIATEQNVTQYGQRDACFDTWNVLDLTIDEASNRTRGDNQLITIQQDILSSSCPNSQPSFYLVTKLTPYTRYAAYVKTYTTLQEKKGAHSSIIYFRTLPGSPSPPLSLTVESLSANSVDIKWLPPAMPNGTIILYHVELQANSYNKPNILSGNTNYCSNPSTLVNMINGRAEEAAPAPEPRATGAVANGSCACQPAADDKPARFTSRAEEERMETINFENELQNQVYKKSDKPKTKVSPAKRVKRSVELSLNSMLVKLTESSSPKPNKNYTNETGEAKCGRVEPNVCTVKDSTGYVKSLYYELGGSERSLTVHGMRHFTWYTVNIWACRARHQNESSEDYEATWCSERAFYTFRTSELLNADVASNVQAVLVPSNKTLPEVNVTWDPPRNPNGFVVAYSVHYSRVEDTGQGQDVGLQSCVTAGDEDRGGRSYPLRNLQPGNYSVKVTPITVAGAGNVSTEVFVFIPERQSGSGLAWVWGVAGGCAALALVVAGGAWYLRRGLLGAAEASKLFATVNPEYVPTVYVPDEWEVPRSNIEFVRELGQGSFGMVYEGIVKNIEKGKSETRCAVKTVNEHATDRERHEFLNEASVMKAFDTFHVVRLLGVVSRGQPTLVVMELMQCGDLKTYLRSHRPDADASLPRKGPATPPTLQNILQMAIEIADGMAYLSAKKFVHRDLAARNCMVAGDLTVKVGDFGMTRDIYETDYYRKGTKGLLPVRWMSPESLKDGVFSSSTDVWSYGVVLWEMATLAMQPYQGLSNEQVVRYVVEGGVMERPEHCPDRLYELMRACWAHRAPQRPAFLQLVADLAPSAQPHFRHRSFFHTPQGQEMYTLQRNALEEEQEAAEVSVGAVASASGDLFGVSGRLASWVRELSSLRSRASDDAAAEPLQPLRARRDAKPAPNGVAQAAQPAPC